MKKISTIILLTLIIVLTVCVRSYATVDDNLQNNESSIRSGGTDLSTNNIDDEDSSTDPDNDSDGDDDLDTDGTEGEPPDIDDNNEGEDNDPSTNPGGNDGEEEPETNPDEDKNDNNAVYSTQDTTTNIKLSANVGVVPDGTSLQVNKITNGEVFNAISEKLGNVKFSIFDISLLSNNTAVQPNNGTVKISIPIPSGYDSSNLIVYRFANDGTKEQEYTVTVDGNYAVIETDHFSNYVLAEKEVTANAEKNNSQLDNEPKTGISNPITIIISTLVFACLGLIICIRKLSK